jgi:hypothetical protein
VYHYLYPGKLSPRAFEKEVLGRNPNLDVRWHEVISRIDELQSLLHLKVSEVAILPGPILPKEQALLIITAPQDTPIYKSDEVSIKKGPDVAAIICWRKTGTYETHAASNVESQFMWHEYLGRGGKIEQAVLNQEGYSPGYVFYLKRIDVPNNA